MMPRPQTAGLLSIIAALLVPSWWMLPQVLAGLGALSVTSAGCLVWLEELQSVFATIAAGALAYQSWLVWRRPASRRTAAMLAILAASIGVSLLVVAVWAILSLRYRW